MSEKAAVPVPASWQAPLCWLIRGRTPAASHALLLPASGWLAIFMLGPVLYLLALSTAALGPAGEVVYSPSLANFSRALDAKYLPVLWRTLAFAGGATLLCLALGYPLAYYLSFRAGPRREKLLIALMLPFWTSCLVSIYSWIIILGRNGLINALLLRLGFIRSEIVFLHTPFSVMLGLVYFYLPFMVLPLYSSLEKIPRNLIEAAEDLGAGVPETFLKVVLPLSLPGALAGCLLTFIPCMGDFLTAEFLGGRDNYLVGNLISSQFLAGQDAPFGAALTALLIASLAGGLILQRRLEAREALERR